MLDTQRLLIFTNVLKTLILPIVRYIQYRFLLNKKRWQYARRVHCHLLLVYIMGLCEHL